MSTVSTLPGGRVLVSVKGAPETIKTMLSVVPNNYDETFKWFTRRGSRVLALGMKEMAPVTLDKVHSNPPTFQFGHPLIQHFTPRSITGPATRLRAS